MSQVLRKTCVFGVAVWMLVGGIALAQKPRAISRLPFTIDAPGSYTLKSSLTGVSGSPGITITASDVTLDLAGFALAGVAGATDGIIVPGSVTNLVIRNGIVRGWPQSGILALYARNGQFERLNLTQNGWGLLAGEASLISRCTAVHNTYWGIYAPYGNSVLDCVAAFNGSDGFHLLSGNTISRCSARDNGGDGIRASTENTITDCTVTGNSNNGINAAEANSIQNCTARLNAGAGISALTVNRIQGCTSDQNGMMGVYVFEGSTVLDCTATRNSQSGISVGGRSIVRGCMVRNNSTAGIYVTGTRTRIEGNHLTGNQYGIEVQPGLVNNVIIQNSAAANTSGNYSIPSGNDLGPTGTAATATSPWANISHP